MSTSLAVVRDVSSIEPSSLTELRELAKDAAASDFFGAKTPAQALLIMMAGKDLGLSYTQALRSFYVVKGKPSLSADGMVGVCLQHRDMCEYFRPIEDTLTSSTWETKRTDNPPRRLTFTMEDAQRAGLVNDMYRKFPSRMLSARCRSFLARDVYPDLLAGLYDPDELGQSDEKPRKGVVVVAVPATVTAAERQENYPERIDHTQDGEIVEEPSNTAKAFQASIMAATDLANLKETGERIGEAGLPPFDTAWLSPIFAARKRALKASK